MTNKNKEVEEGSWIEFVENGKCGLELIATGLTSCHLAGKHQQSLGNEVKISDSRTELEIDIWSSEEQLVWKNINF